MGEGEETALLTLISQSRKDFCQIFARVLHVVGFGKSFPNTFCTFCELLLFLMWRACVITFAFVLLPLCSFAAAFWHSLTPSQLHSHSHSLTHTHTQDATQRVNCVITKVEHKNKNVVSFVKFSLLLLLLFIFVRYLQMEFVANTGEVPLTTHTTHNTMRSVHK